MIAAVAERAPLALAATPEVVIPELAKPLPWVDADSVPELHAARLLGKQQAEALLEERKQLLRDGAFDQVPYIIDPLSTAARANAAKRQYGEHSEQYCKARQLMDVNSRRYLAEAWRQNTWEYFAELPQEYEPEAGSYFFHGESLTKIVHDGISPATDPEELDYRLTEAVEESTYVGIRRLSRLTVDEVVFLQPGTPRAELTVAQRPEVSVLTVSQCSDDAIEAYKRGSSDWRGYAPQIEKLMIRRIRFSDVKDVRYQSTLAIPGTKITNEIINQALQILRMTEAGSHLTKAEIRKKQMINLNGSNELDFVQLLDELASRASGKRIFLGEEIPEDQPKDYASVPALAQARQEKLDDDAVKLTEYLQKLEATGIDHWAAKGHVQAFIDKLLFDKVKEDPKQAAIVFDQKTADGIQAAMDLRARGDYEAAGKLLEKVEREAPPSGGCGAGSCGLEAVNPKSFEAMRARELGLRGENILHDTERACPDCQKKTIYYDERGSKVCINPLCEKREIK